MHAHEPFSYTAIDALEDFTLAQPHYMKASDGVQLAYYSFLSDDNHAITILYAGAGMYGNKTYQWVAKTLNEKHNIGCYIFDIRGHGHSEGERGDAPSIKQVWDDVAHAIEFVKKKHADKKLYVIGHSSGAGLIINYAAQCDTMLEDGYIFLAPFLGPKSHTDKKHEYADERFIKSIRLWVYALGMMFPNSWIIHCKALFFNYPDARLQKDPLILSFYTFAMSCAVTPYDIKTLLPRITKPVGIFIGDGDEQFIPEAVIAYKDLLVAPSDTKIVPNAAHLSILLHAPTLITKSIHL